MAASTQQVTAQHPLRHRAIVLVGGAGLVAFAVLLVDAVWSVWPAIEEISRRGNAGGAAATAPLPDVDLFLMNVDLTVSEGQAYLVLVTVFGMLGSFIHTATSFATYVGNDQFRLSWAFWYVLRPFIGGAVALVLILAVLGGLVTLSANGSDFDPQALNPYTIAAFAALAGWFSKAASDKLEEVFDLLLKNSKDNERDDKLTEASPAIEQVFVVATTTGYRLTITGANLGVGSMVTVGDTSHSAALDAHGRLVVDVPDLPSGAFDVVVDSSKRASRSTSVGPVMQRSPAAAVGGGQRESASDARAGAPRVLATAGRLLTVLWPR